MKSILRRLFFTAHIRPFYLDTGFEKTKGSVVTQSASA